MDGETSMANDAGHRGHQICILGAKNLCSEMLAYVLKKEICESCDIVSDFATLAGFSATRRGR
jgi:hypothetical protein